MDMKNILKKSAIGTLILLLVVAFFANTTKTHFNAPLSRFINRGIIYQINNKNAVACILIHDTAIILFRSDVK